MNPARLKAYLALASAALLYGASQPIIKPALSYVNSVQYMFLRYLAAAPFAVLFLFLTYRKFKPNKKNLLSILAVEIISLTNLMLLYTGLKYTTALQSALIINSKPIFITLMGIWFLNERQEKNEWAGLSLSTLGTLLVIISPYFFYPAAVGGSAKGNLIIIMTNVISAIYTFFMKKTYQGIPKTFITGVHILYGLVFFGVISLGTTNSLPLQALQTPEVLLPVVYMGLFGSLVAATFSTYGYLKVEASEATLFQYLEPLVYIPLAVFWLHEPLLPLQLIGLCFIIIGVITGAARIPGHRRRRLFQSRPLARLLRLAQAPSPSSQNILR